MFLTTKKSSIQNIFKLLQQICCDYEFQNNGAAKTKLRETAEQISSKYYCNKKVTDSLMDKD